uniref:RING-type domain-containing protein n=1 Tax=viral metagenome TaxID=1070528 RepID=A0A6C0K6W1_9ZZZZ
MSRDDSLSSILDVYEQPLRNGNTDNSDYALQPAHIKVSLKPHQLAMIHAMQKKETESVEGFTIHDETHYSQYAILGDKVGSGKTLTTLGFISTMKANIPTRVFSRIHPQSQSTFWSRKAVYNQECSGNILIIVPHTLYHQWKFAIQQQSSLSFLEVKTQKAFEKPDFFQNMKQRDITLMSNTIIRPFLSTDERKSIQWSRIFFDEVDSIHFSSTVPMPQANFYWFISATWQNFIFQGLYLYMNESYLTRRVQAGIHPELLSIFQCDQIMNGNNYYSRYDIKSAPFFSEFLTKHPSRGHAVLRTTDSFMEKSWKAPPILDRRIDCEAPIQHRIVAQYVGPEIQELLHAGDIQGALEKLGVSNTSQSSLVTALCETREKELDRLEKTLIFKESIEYVTPQAKELAIQSLKSKIHSLKEQIESLKQRIMNVKEEVCAICFEDPKNPTLVICCSRLFCGACIIKCLQCASSCPMCRSPLDFQKLRHIDLNPLDTGGSNTENVIVKPVKPTKKDALFKLITDTKGGRFLIFNRYDNPFYEIEEQLLEKGVRVASVRGNKDHISSILKQFEKGEIQVLLMNSMQAGAGIDLKSATHIVLMHMMKKEEEKQIIGRAVRLGRTEPLHLVRLLHENESLLNWITRPY